MATAQAARRAPPLDPRSGPCACGRATGHQPGHAGAADVGAELVRGQARSWTTRGHRILVRCRATAIDAGCDALASRLATAGLDAVGSRCRDGRVDIAVRCDLAVVARRPGDTRRRSLADRRGTAAQEN